MSPPEHRVLPAAPSSGEEPGAGGIRGCVGPRMGLDREVVSKFRASFCSEGKRRLAFLYREVG